MKHNSFISLKPKSKRNVKSDDQSTISTLETQSVNTSQFINEISRQWPSWRRVKQTIGVVDPPNIKQFVYQRRYQIPYPQYLFRGQSKVYEYYIDIENGCTYFYPKYGIYFKNEQIFSHPTQLNGNQPVVVVASSIAIPQLIEYVKKFGDLK